MLKGSAVALVTPMLPDGEIDWQRFGDHIEWQIKEGTKAIVPVGTTGESATVSVAEHCSLVRTAVEAADGKVPVIAGTGANSTSEAIELTLAAKNSGADACLLVTPYYNKPTQDGLFQHFEAIGKAVELPQLLYNVPSRTGCDLLPETVARLSDMEFVIGIKEATGDLERAKAIRNLSDISIYSGDDATSCDLMLQGAMGTISVTANVAPAKLALMTEAALSGDVELAKKVDKELAGLHENLFLESNPIPVKWALYHMGKIDSGIRLPMTRFSSGHHEMLLRSMVQAGVVE
ncbi:MAG: 4-hydroxy-tetrahydrodipicolinate synthase [Gammaproteobacteria bacterium]|nr:4-hydroxy-tetrahydrodipicolinate synthase [Gammaproteobacteria bacterium]